MNDFSESSTEGSDARWSGVSEQKVQEHLKGAGKEADSPSADQTYQTCV